MQGQCMLGDAGSVASLVGVPVSLFGLLIAISQILKLRGETRATQQSVEKTRNVVDRDNARINLARVNERIEGLKELHRRNEWSRALDRYTEVGKMLTDIRIRHPELTDEQRSTIQRVVSRLSDMGRKVDLPGGVIPPENSQRFNVLLWDDQLLLTEIESTLQQST